MSLRISVRNINRRKLYKVQEAANHLKVCAATIRRMIKSGLPVVSKNSNPVYILGKDLLEYVKRKNAKLKVDLKDDEFFCFTCKTAVKSIPDELKIFFTQKNGVKSFIKQNL
jgi:hypothetical protein